MPLRVTTDVDVEADVFWHGLFVPVTADMILANVRGGVAVLFHGFRDGDRFYGDIFALFRADKLRVFPANAASTVAVQTAHNIDVVMNASRILSA